MKLFTLDLEGLKDGKQSLDLIAQYIKDQDIDVCFFQDATQKADGFKIDNTLRVGNNAGYIAGRLGYVIYFEPVLKGDLEVGLAVISKKPLTFVKKWFLNKLDDRDPNHLSLLLQVKTFDTSFFVTKLGFDYDSEVILEEVKNLLEITNKHEEKIYLAGNFRYPDGSNVINELKKHLYSASDMAGRSSSLNPTYKKEVDYEISEDYDKPDNLMVDYIFMNIFGKVQAFDIAFKDEEVSLHNGVYIEY